MAPPTDPVSNTQNSSNKDYRYGSKTGVCLTCPVTLNQNPLDIEIMNGGLPFYTSTKWNLFISFIYGPGVEIYNFNPKDLTLNTSQYNQQITKDFINKFNTDTVNSPWAAKGILSPQNPYYGTNNPLTQEDIWAVQRFNHKTDSNVQIDGWLGTQTLMLRYPTPAYFVKKFGTYEDVYGRIHPRKGNIDVYLFPAVWGDKRFVVKNTEVKVSLPGETVTAVEKLTNPNFILYDPTIHTLDKFQAWTPQYYNRVSDYKIDPNIDFPPWRNLGSTVSLTPSAEQTNSQTTRNQADTTNRANQTSIIRNINR